MNLPDAAVPGRGSFLHRIRWLSWGYPESLAINRYRALRGTI